MDKGLTFLTLSLVFLWLVFDDFVGKKRLSNLATMMTPDLSLPVPQVVQDAKEQLDKAQQKGLEKDKKATSELEQQKKDDKKKSEDVKKNGWSELFDFSWLNGHIYNQDHNEISSGRGGKW